MLCQCLLKVQFEARSSNGDYRQGCRSLFSSIKSALTHLIDVEIFYVVTPIDSEKLSERMKGLGPVSSLCLRKNSISLVKGSLIR